MNNTPVATMQVSLPVDLIGSLLLGRDAFCESFVEALDKAMRAWGGDENQCSKNTVPTQRKKYAAEFLSTEVTADSLPEIFSQIVDLTVEVAPEAIDHLALMRADSRRFVARNPKHLHPGRPHLPVVKTKSGWWISKNIGQRDLIRALRALSQATQLEFDTDVKFRGRDHGSMRSA